MHLLKGNLVVSQHFLQNYDFLAGWDLVNSELQAPKYVSHGHLRKLQAGKAQSTQQRCHSLDKRCMNVLL